MAETKHDDGGPAYPFFYPGDTAGVDGTAMQYDGMSLRDYYAGLNVPERMVDDIISLDDSHLAKLVGADPDEMTFLLRADKNDPVYQTNAVLRLRWVAQAIAITRGIIADAMIAEKRRREAGR